MQCGGISDPCPTSGSSRQPVLGGDAGSSPGCCATSSNSGWYGDPRHEHDFRYWDGDRGQGDRLAKWAVGVLLVGGAVALAATVVWGEWMKISSTLDSEDRVRGWTAVFRGLLTAIIAWAVPIVAMVLAVRACRLDSVTLGRTVILIAGCVPFVVSISLIGGTLESAMTDSRPELSWMLLQRSDGRRVRLRAGDPAGGVRRPTSSEHLPGETAPPRRSRRFARRAVMSAPCSMSRVVASS